MQARLHWKKISTSEGLPLCSKPTQSSRLIRRSCTNWKANKQTTMRVAQILQLGHDLSTLVQFALVFNQSSRRFEVTSPDGAVGPPFVDAQVSLPTGMSTTGNSTQAQFQRERVMRAMAQQRLQSEVHTLESSTRGCLWLCANDISICGA